MNVIELSIGTVTQSVRNLVEAGRMYKEKEILHERRKVQCEMRSKPDNGG